MSERLAGKPVAQDLYRKTRARSEQYTSVTGFVPKAAVIRVGEKAEDLSYEKGIRRHAEEAGVVLETHALAEDAGEAEIIACIHRLNEDREVTGILLFLPLPAGIDQQKVVNEISPAKDLDGATDASKLHVYTGQGVGFAPCTPEAVLVLLDFYGIRLEGAHAVIIGRSMVVGKPLSMLLLKRNATVTVCHSRTRDLKKLTRGADILISAAGKIGMVTPEMVCEEQTVIDVGINFDDHGKMKGDVLYDDVVNAVRAVTPVPGGVGAVTTAVLLSHAVPEI